MSKIVEVIPISKGIGKESLTYFSSKEIKEGDIVAVPIRKKFMDALVVSIKDASLSKSSVKNFGFNLKKIAEAKGKAFFTPSFFKSCLRASKYFVGNMGDVFCSLIPTTLITELNKIKPPTTKIEDLIAGNNIKQEKLVFQSPLSERIDFYKKLVRQSFAEKKSVYLCVPTIRDIEEFYDYLKKGIEDYVFIFHNDLKPKDLISHFNEASNKEHPVLIIATGYFFSIPRDDIKTIIVEKESSGFYKTYSRPYVDLRIFAEIYSKEIGAKFILSDTLLRVETLWRFDHKLWSDTTSSFMKDLGDGNTFELEFYEAAPLLFKIPSQAKKEIIDTKKELIFSAISEKLKKEIKYLVESNKKVFLFALRKGLAPVTVCGDCKTLFACDSCDSPLTLYTKTINNKEVRFFMCNKCKTKKDSLNTCANCGSWNLKTLGVGTDLVYEELIKEIPEGKVFKIDKESSKTNKQAEKILNDFLAEKGAVLIGTEMVIPLLRNSIGEKGLNLVAVTSLDSLFNIPDFRINEKIIHLLLDLEALTKEELIIQTRNAEEKILEQFMNRQFLEFYKDEISERKQLFYPPYSNLVKISGVMKKDDLFKNKQELESIFEGFRIDIFQGYVRRINNNFILNAVLKIERGKWAKPILNKKDYDEVLSEKLVSLAPKYKVEIDPENLF